MYGASWCPHCQNQKRMFGNSWKNINYVECAGNEEACWQTGITGYPTWEINNQKFSGEMTLEGLSQASGCSLK